MTSNRHGSSQLASDIDGITARDNPLILDFEREGTEIDEAIKLAETILDRKKVECGHTKHELEKAEERSKAIERELAVKRRAYDMLEKIHTSLGKAVEPWPAELPRTALSPFAEGGYHPQFLALADVLSGYGGVFAELVQSLTTVPAIEKEDLRKMRQELSRVESQLTAARSCELVAEDDWHKAVNKHSKWKQELEGLWIRKAALLSERWNQAICFLIYLGHSAGRNIPLPGYATPHEPDTVASPSQHTLPTSTSTTFDIPVPTSVSSSSAHQPGEMVPRQQLARTQHGGGTETRIQPPRACRVRRVCRKRKRSEE